MHCCIPFRQTHALFQYLKLIMEPAQAYQSLSLSPFHCLKHFLICKLNSKWQYSRQSSGLCPWGKIKNKWQNILYLWHEDVVLTLYFILLFWGLKEIHWKSLFYSYQYLCKIVSRSKRVCQFSLTWSWPGLASLTLSGVQLIATTCNKGLSQWCSLES